MNSEKFIAKLRDVSSLEDSEQYNALRELGVELGLSYGRLEIMTLHSVDERNLSAGQKAEFFKLLHENVDILKKQFLIENPADKNDTVSAPYLKSNGELIIPHDCHARYKYWLQNTDTSWKHLETSQSLRDTLLELKAPKYVMIRYLGKI